MSLDIALVTYLAGHAALVPLIGDRIYPLLAPTQAVMPYLLYAEIHDESTQHLLGAGELAMATYQWDVYGRTHRSAREVAKAFKLLMNGYRGVSAGVAIRRVLVRGMDTGLEDDQAGGQQIASRVTLETDDWYMQPVTT